MAFERLRRYFKLNMVLLVVGGLVLMLAASKDWGRRDSVIPSAAVDGAWGQEAAQPETVAYWRSEAMAARARVFELQNQLYTLGIELRNRIEADRLELDEPVGVRRRARAAQPRPFDMRSALRIDRGSLSGIRDGLPVTCLGFWSARRRRSLRTRPGWSTAGYDLPLRGRHRRSRRRGAPAAGVRGRSTPRISSAWEARRPWRDPRHPVDGPGGSLGAGPGRLGGLHGARRGAARGAAPRHRLLGWRANEGGLFLELRVKPAVDLELVESLEVLVPPPGHVIATPGRGR